MIFRVDRADVLDVDAELAPVPGQEAGQEDIGAGASSSSTSRPSAPTCPDDTAFQRFECSMLGLGSPSDAQQAGTGAGRALRVSR